MNRSRLHDVAVRVRHDLGKYATLQSRWLPPDAPAADRLEAARADLLHTASGSLGDRDAAQLARPFLEELHALDDPAGAALAQALQALIDAVVALRALDPNGPGAFDAAARGQASALAVRDAARALADRTRADDLS